MGILGQIRSTATSAPENTLVEEICRPPVPVASQVLSGKETFAGTDAGTAGTGACQPENQVDSTTKFSENEKFPDGEKFSTPSTPLVEPSPCPTCGSPGFWHSVYGGDLKCLACDPPPGRALIRRRLLIVSEPVDPRHPGGPWRRVLEPWEWHFGDLNRGGSGEEITTIVDDTGLGDPQTVAVIAWRYDRLGTHILGSERLTTIPKILPEFVAR